jgi:membrane-bound ClpP family serine protease
MDPLLWSIILLLVGIALVACEVFVPSGGVLGFLSLASLGSSIALAFYHRGLEVGLIFLSAAALAVPVTLIFTFRWWPHTAMGKRLLLNIPTSQDVLPDTPQRRKLSQRVGKVGTATSQMLPGGAISVGGVSVDAISEGMPIEVGQRVRIINVRGNRVLVRPVTDEAEAEPSDDILSRPIESLGLEPFDDPLA